MLNYFSTVLLILISSFAFCSNTKQEVFNIVTETNNEKQDTVIEQVVEEAKFESLSDSLILKINNECKLIDGTFYNTAKSISLYGKNVKHILAMIENKKPLAIDNNIIGHLMLLTEDTEIAFVEISMKEGNNYLIYNINGKKYYNVLGEAGNAFFAKWGGNVATK